MKRLILLSGLSFAIFASSCVSKKKFTALEGRYDDAQTELSQLSAENEEYRSKLDDIEGKINDYYAKISRLQDENAKKLELTDGKAISENAKKAMRNTLKNVDPQKLAQAKTLGDSIDLAVSYNLQKSLGDGVDVTVDRTVVEITVSNDLLFRSGSYWVSQKAYGLLEKIGETAKSEPAMEILVEGHTDSQTLVEESYIEDNWDLSLRRAASVVRILQDKYGVDGEQLIAAGRSSYKPVGDNASAEGREKNRRTRIIILPNLEKFLALLES